MIQRKCDRCGASFAYGTVHTMSRFNEDEICLDCNEDEQLAPGYAAAAAAVLEQVKLKNYGFPGVGLSDADKAFLKKRREERKVGHEK